MWRSAVSITKNYYEIFVIAANVHADVMIAATLKKRKGEEYLYLKTVKSKLSVGQASANFENLFNGDPTLST